MLNIQYITCTHCHFYPSGPDILKVLGDAAILVLSTDAPSVKTKQTGRKYSYTSPGLDIRSEAKFRRLKAFAESANISGLAKKGQPGVLVFDGGNEDIRTFLFNARSLRYLDFHHVETAPLPIHTNHRLADGRIGLHEVKNMTELVRALETISMKEWFRQNMGMTGGR